MLLQSFSQGSQQKGRDLEERGGGRVASVDREDEERVQQTVIREHMVGRQIDLYVIVRKDHHLSKISLIVNPAKGCLTCSYIHIYMQNKSRPNSRKKYWCKPPTPPVSWDRQSALGGWGRICRNGSHAPRSSNQQSLRRDN